MTWQTKNSIISNVFAIIVPGQTAIMVGLEGKTTKSRITLYHIYVVQCFGALTIYIWGHAYIYMHICLFFASFLLLCDKTPCMVYYCAIVIDAKGIGILWDDMIWVILLWGQFTIVICLTCHCTNIWSFDSAIVLLLNSTQMQTEHYSN